MRLKFAKIDVIMEEAYWVVGAGGQGGAPGGRKFSNSLIWTIIAKIMRSKRPFKEKDTPKEVNAID